MNKKRKEAKLRRGPPGSIIVRNCGITSTFLYSSILSGETASIRRGLKLINNEDWYWYAVYFGEWIGE